MVAFSQKDVQNAQGKLDHIRCVCVLGDRRQGKTSLVHLLQTAQGITASEDADSLRQTVLVPAATETQVPSIAPLEVHSLLYPGKEEVKEPNLLRRGSAAAAVDKKRKVYNAALAYLVAYEAKDFRAGGSVCCPRSPRYKGLERQEDERGEVCRRK